MILSPAVTLRARQYDHETLSLAMEELTQFLSVSPGMTACEGGDIEVDFTLGQARGYSVSVCNNALRFVAPTPVEILYAVYTFAEELLGFCFFEPGHDRVAPKREVALPDGIVVTERVPLLKNRGLIQEYPCDESNYRLADWMARNRLNYLMTWTKHYDGFSASLKEHYRVRGITVESGHHSFDYYLPLAKYGKDHPEYFAMRDGKRIEFDEKDNTLFLSKQLCVTNPDVRAELAKNMIAYVKRNPEVRVISLVPNDGFGWCECEACAKHYDTSKRGGLYCVSEHVYRAEDIYNDLVRDVAARVHEECPDVTVTLCAYINYIEPADGFKLTKGTAVHAAPYWHCINHRMGDPVCPINRRYMESLAKWGKIKDGGEFNIYEYYMGVNFYVSLPMVHHEVVFDDLRSFVGIGVDGVTTQYHLTHWTAYGLNYYMMAKAAYGEDREAAVAKCMRDLFGDDAEQGAAFYRDLREVVLSAGPCHVPIARSLFKRTKLAQYTAMKEKAEALLARKPDDRLRRNLVVWMEYLLRFKTVFDRYIVGGKDVREEIRAFEAWAGKQGAHDVCVMSRLSFYLPAWIQAIEAGKPWLHFNIDWEDEYVRRYDELLNRTDW